MLFVSVLAVTLTEGTICTMLHVPGIPKPIYESCINFNCTFIQTYFHHLCPFHKGGK